MHCRSLGARCSAVLGGHGGPVASVPSNGTQSGHNTWTVDLEHSLLTPSKSTHKISCDGLSITALSGLNSVLTALGRLHKETGKHLVPKGSIKEESFRRLCNTEIQAFQKK